VEVDARAAAELEGFVQLVAMALELAALYRVWPNCQAAPADGKTRLDPERMVLMKDRPTI